MSLTKKNEFPFFDFPIFRYWWDGAQAREEEVFRVWEAVRIETSRDCTMGNWVCTTFIYVCLLSFDYQGRSCRETYLSLRTHQADFLVPVRISELYRTSNSAKTPIVAFLCVLTISVSLPRHKQGETVFLSEFDQKFQNRFLCPQCKNYLHNWKNSSTKRRNQL